MTMQITDKDIQTFRERAKTELQSNGAVGRLAWDSVVDALCDEVEELRKNAATGNAAALREAAERICSINQPETQDLRQLAQFCHDQSIYGGGLIERVLGDIEIVRQALSAPPRNCDVGTAHEQYVRFEKHCNRKWKDYTNTDKRCPFPCGRNDMTNNPCARCFATWAQLPFTLEKGGAE